MDKEQLRQKRKEAYQQAKAKRDADPRYQALKEKIKQERRAKYQAMREKNKNEKRKAKLKKRAEKDAALLALLMPASELEMQE